MDVDLEAGPVVLVAPFDGGDEGFDALRVELRAGAEAELGERRLLAERGTSGSRSWRRTSATWTMAGSTRARPSTAAVAASDVVSPATGARKSIRRRSSTDTPSCLRTRAYSRRGEPARLVQDLVRHDELADVVHERRVAETLHAARAEPELGADVLAEHRGAMRAPGGVAVLGLEGEDQRLDRLLLRRAQLEVTGERAPCDQDRDDEQWHHCRAQLQVHPPQPQPQNRKRICTEIEANDFAKRIGMARSNSAIPGCSRESS